MLCRRAIGNGNGLRTRKDCSGSAIQAHVVVPSWPWPGRTERTCAPNVLQQSYCPRLIRGTNLQLKRNMSMTFRVNVNSTIHSSRDAFLRSVGRRLKQRCKRYTTRDMQKAYTSITQRQHVRTTMYSNCQDTSTSPAGTPYTGLEASRPGSCSFIPSLYGGLSAAASRTYGGLCAAAARILISAIFLLKSTTPPFCSAFVFLASFLASFFLVKPLVLDDIRRAAAGRMPGRNQRWKKHTLDFMVVRIGLAVKKP